MMNMSFRQQIFALTLCTALAQPAFAQEKNLNYYLQQQGNNAVGFAQQGAVQNQLQIEAITQQQNALNAVKSQLSSAAKGTPEYNAAMQQVNAAESQLAATKNALNQVAAPLNEVTKQINQATLDVQNGVAGAQAKLNQLTGEAQKLQEQATAPVRELQSKLGETQNALNSSLGKIPGLEGANIDLMAAAKDPKAAMQNIANTAVKNVTDKVMAKVQETVGKVTDAISAKFNDMLAKSGLGGALGGMLGGLAGGLFGGGGAGAGPPVAAADSAHQQFLDTSIASRWIPDIAQAASDLSTSTHSQTAAIGQMMDARQQMEAQLAMQSLAAKTRRDYQTDTQLCTIGTNIRSLAASGEKAKANARMLDNFLMARETLKSNSINTVGTSGDIPARMSQFFSTYCSKETYGGAMKSLCKAQNPGRANADIDFNRTVSGPYTIEADFTDAAQTPAEEDIIALGRNLFAATPFPAINKNLLAQDIAQDEFGDMRSVTAIRGVARNSFAHIVGMRMQGAGGAENAKFMGAILSTLGVPESDRAILMGQNPSYFAQMDVLTQKIYQSPSFFTNLYTTPANVERTGAALQAIGLMQDRDRYESALRREGMISLILEMRVRELQDSVTNDIIRSVGDMLGKSPI